MAGRFLTPLVVENLATDEQRNARVVSPLVYVAADLRQFDVPAGFRSDLASIPQLLQAVVGKWERHAPAAVLHDWLYLTHEVDRRTADDVFAEAMRSLGVPAWKRRSMWTVVRVFAGFAWKADLSRHAQSSSGEKMYSDHVPRISRIDRFDACLAETLRWESGEIQVPGGAIVRGKFSYANDPHDPGGPTMVGVIQRVYDGWRQSMGLARRPVRDIEDHEIRAIYRQNYWNLVRGDELPPGVDLAVFDFGVNSGCARAVKYLQRIVGVTPDGAFGALTLAAVHRHDPADLVQRLMADRRTFVRKIPHYWRFGKGWETRLKAVERVAMAMLGGTQHPAPGPVPGPATGSSPAGSPLSGSGRATVDAPETMAGPTTGTTAAAIGTGGFVQIGLEVGSAAAKVQASGSPVDVANLLIALMQSVSFWVAAATIAGSVYVWLERRRKLLESAV